MGYYIQTPLNIGKAAYLIVNYGAVPYTIEDPESFEIPEGKTLICVVKNEGVHEFDAAAIIEDEDRFLDFNDPFDNRSKTWLLMDNLTVLKLCPEAEGVVPKMRMAPYDGVLSIAA